MGDSVLDKGWVWRKAMLCGLWWWWCVATIRPITTVLGVGQNAHTMRSFSPVLRLSPTLSMCSGTQQHDSFCSPSSLATPPWQTLASNAGSRSHQACPHTCRRCQWCSRSLTSNPAGPPGAPMRNRQGCQHSRGLSWPRYRWGPEGRGWRQCRWTR